MAADDHHLPDLPAASGDTPDKAGCGPVNPAHGPTLTAVATSNESPPAPEICPVCVRIAPGAPAAITPLPGSGDLQIRVEVSLAMERRAKRGATR